MKKTTQIFFAMLLLGVGMLQAQNEFRINQPIPDSVNYCITIPAGWEVRIVRAEHAGVTVITPCEMFYEEANEPEVCRLEGRHLTILKNSSMPKSTILEIAVKWPIRILDIEKNAHVTTGALVFDPYGEVTIDEGAKVSGTSWSGLGNMEVEVWNNASLRLDTLRAAGQLDYYRSPEAFAECPVIEAAGGDLKIDKHSKGTDYSFHTPKNLTLKTVNHKWRNTFLYKMNLSFGIRLPYTLYTNAQYGSAYNFDQQVALVEELDFGSLSFKRLSIRPSFLVEFSYSRLINHVATDGKSLTVVTPTSGLLPKQSLLNNQIGVSLNFDYGIGPYNVEHDRYDFSLTWGLSFMHSVNPTLRTKTLGTDNRWDKTNEEADVFNPWQLRAKVGLNLAPTLGGHIDLYYDLLPTYRSGIGADGIHCLGITLSL